MGPSQLWTGLTKYLLPCRLIANLVLKRFLPFIRLSVKRLQYRGKNQTANIRLRIIVSCHRLQLTFCWNSLCFLMFSLSAAVHNLYSGTQWFKGYQPVQDLEKENWIQNQEWNISFWQCPQPRYVSVPRIYEKSSKEVFIGLPSRKWNKWIDYVNITSRQIDKKKINECP